MIAMVVGYVVEVSPYELERVNFKMLQIAITKFVKFHRCHFWLTARFVCSHVRVTTPPTQGVICLAVGLYTLFRTYRAQHRLRDNDLFESPRLCQREPVVI